MTELKTLKDITHEAGYDEGHFPEWIEKDELKQEAIKWYKDKTQPTAYGLLTDMNGEDWKKFFNITEEELK